LWSRSIKETLTEVELVVFEEEDWDEWEEDDEEEEDW
jgi:hypothetical protein